MCGIIGYTGKQQAATVLLDGLTRLEYRGYDSAGIATVFNGDLHLKKGIGKLEEVEQECSLSRLPGNTGIGHVRWATHGGVTAINAHPHLDCLKYIAVAHNGILDNYLQLKRKLGSKHEFISETDTEVIVHLIEEHLLPGVPLEQAVIRATRELRGTYALVVTSIVEPQKIVAIRKGSPLVVGFGKGENFVSSDFQAFLPYTRKVLFLDDKEAVVITPNKINILSGSGKKISKDPIMLDVDLAVRDKNGFDFFMLKEIFDQPQAIISAMKQDRETLQKAATLVNNCRSVVFTACGSSRYASLIGRYMFSKIAHRFSDVITSSEFSYFGDAVDENTLVIAVSQSGETADVIEGIKEAQSRGAKVLSIINTFGSTLARMSDCTLYLNCGAEFAVAATKSFISQLVLLYLLSFSIAGRLEEAETELQHIAELLEENLRVNHYAIPKTAIKLANHDKFYYIARGINFAVAGEASLKLKEVAYVHSEGMSAGELKHGTLALIEEGSPVIAIAPCDGTRDDILSNISEVKARGAFIIGVSDKPDKLFDIYIEIPKVNEYFYPLACIIPLQLFAFHSSIARSLDPDRPRNLAKSVTVT
ncbi:MAG: glutamine--fructose-6-phosphate transaminase (isomerizing) [Dehalococcoidales bacterium]|nr:glutamine--fructose-6-phosphate transaminase (isomerizing) [Dehalococcoidales bacterium]